VRDTRIFSNENWAQLVNHINNELAKLALVKGGEYSGDTDRLANFRRNAENLGLLKESVWAVYAGKHWDSIMQYIKDLQAGVNRPRAEKMEGRALDLILYLMLFIAMEEERSYPEAQKRLEQLQQANSIGAGVGKSFLVPD
jgi:hypothetical protein